MEQITTRVTGKTEKIDINGNGDANVIDANGEYQPSNNDEVEERKEGNSTRRLTPPKVGMILRNVVK